MDEQQAIRQHIAAQTCPFCGSGPFVMLPVHTSKAHGVDKWALRDLAGLTSKEPLCDPEALAKMSDAAKRNDGNRVKANEAQRANGRSVQRWTAAGRRKNAEALAEWERQHPDEAAEARRTNGGRVSPEGRARIQARLREWHAAHPRSPEQIAAFVATVQSPAAIAKRAARRVMPDHGTTARYKRGCKCEPCRDAKRRSRR